MWRKQTAGKKKNKMKPICFVMGIILSFMGVVFEIFYVTELLHVGKHVIHLTSSGILLSLILTGTGIGLLGISMILKYIEPKK